MCFQSSACLEVLFSLFQSCLSASSHSHSSELKLCNSQTQVWVCNIKHMSSCSCGQWCGCAGSRRSQRVWLTPALLLILSSGWSSACRRHGRLMNEHTVCSATTGGRWWRQRGLDKHERKLVFVEDSGYSTHRLNTKTENKKRKLETNFALKNTWNERDHSQTTSRNEARSWAWAQFPWRRWKLTAD